MYTYQLKHDRNGRIIEKIETVGDKTLHWTFAYDKAGRLAEARLGRRLVCTCRYDKQGRRISDHFPLSGGKQVRNYRYTMDNRLQSAGNNGYTHDKSGFRSIWNRSGKYTTYQYAPDYRLLKAINEDKDLAFEFSHDDNGQRKAKYQNGEMVEAYAWLDFLRLAGFHDGNAGYTFAYNKDERTPYAMKREDGLLAYLYYDQVGSLRLVADETGNVIKEILYDPFGGIIEDSNPNLRIPIGFAGGLHDRDLGFVRFGWRDYDTFTGRWTAPDPMGDAGGDNDWYGYCLDDPVNGVDPLGLKGGFFDGVSKIGAGLNQLWEKAPAGISEAVTKGTQGAGEALSKTAEAYATNKDLQKYTAVALGAGALPIAAASAATTAPAVVGAAMQHPEKIAAASKAGADFASGFFDPGPPPPSPAGQWGVGASKVRDWINDKDYLR